MTDVEFEQSFDLDNSITKLLFNLFADSLVSRCTVKLPGAGFQHVLFSVLEEYGQPQLPGQQLSCELDHREERQQNFHNRKSPPCAAARHRACDVELSRSNDC